MMGNAGSVSEEARATEPDCFDRVPRDVLAIIVAMCFDFGSQSEPARGGLPAPPPPVQRTTDLLDKDVLRMVAVSKCVASLASVCRAFARAAATEVVARHALLAAGQRVPARVWYGAKMSDAFRAQYRLLLERLRQARLQERVKEKPFVAVPCGMRAPAPPRPVRVHPVDPPSFAAFSGLNWEEMQRVQKRAESLLQFLRALESFSAGFSAEAALLRYRMFLKLQSDHPNTLLLPTADILFAQMAHIFRTADYHADVASGATALARDPLCLSDDEAFLYNEACVATARLWESSFGELYFAGDARRQHAFFIHQADMSPNERRWRDAKYVPPPAYVTAVGAAPKRQVNGLPEIRLKTSDVQNDLKWMSELELSLRNIRSQAYERLNMNEVTDESVIRHLSTCYQRFLFLCKLHPDMGHDLAPPAAIDLLWHAHQATPRLYEEETTRIVGFRVDHDPWPDGTGRLRPLSNQMQCAWKTAFGTDMTEDHWYRVEKLVKM